MRRTNLHVMSRWATAFLAAVIVCTAAIPVAQSASTEKVYKIGFHLWKGGKIYEEALSGIRDGLELEGIRYEEVVLHSDKDKALAEQNLRKLDAMGLDLIYSLSSAGTKIAKAIDLKTPIIATVINHPASLGVGQVGDQSTTQLTGTSYYIHPEKQLRLYRGLFPNVKTVGMVYDENNPAGYLAEEPFMREACESMGLKFISIGVEEKEELAGATGKLLDSGVDLFVVPTNLLVYGNLDIVLDVTNERHIPVVSMNKQGVENGALAGLFADTYNLGRQTAAMAKQIVVSKVAPMDIAFQYIPEPDVILNLTSADNLGYEFPAEVLSSAAIVMQ